MRLGAALGVLLGAALLVTAPARAGSSVRYALIVGNDHGESEAVSLEDLTKAEAEAHDLRQRLMRYGNFDEERIAMVAGGGREEILAAARRLSARHRQDRAELGDLPTLFIFYFTGHGVEGALLTRDQPLSGADLATIYQEMDATLSVGFFDACFSESLALRGKGAVPTPGFNPLAELPEEVLNAEGSVWFVSSRPDEQSYEDPKLGSLFTYYFLEAFTEGTRDGVAITLDEMWEYARRRTSAHAARYGRSQTPVKVVRHLKARGPLYFSFPAERRAKLRFTSEVEGSFLVQYQHGALVEKIHKPSGEPLEVALYEGEVLLSQLGDKTADHAPTQKLLLQPGRAVTVRTTGTDAAPAAAGYGERQIRGKGALPDLVVTEAGWASTLALTAGYSLALAQPELLFGLHRAELGAAFAHGPFGLSLDVSYGYNGDDYQTWGYQLHEVGLRAVGGYGWRIGALRLDLEAGGAPALSMVSYQSGRERQQLALWLGGGGRVLWPLPFLPQLVLMGRAHVGALRSQGIAAQDQSAYWSPGAQLSLGLAVPVLSL